MSNIGYDLDTSGGLMPLIRALIKPPDEELNPQKSRKQQHPYYKRPGKGHNHDSCDACGEGGDLICCDRCPASFHLGCYDPPLDEHDIPAGLWLCRECRASETDKPASSRSSRAQSPADNKSDTEKKTRTLRNKRTNSTKSKDKDKEKDDEEEKDLSPMEILVKAASIMNPKQFELPREMRVPCPFPGTDKEGSKNGAPSLVTVDSWGCVPLPAKSCYVCQGTCKQAPLLQCDYCPLLFHQDCLDPPLTALPTGRWMCPNHVEQYIDWKLVNSVSASERVALWDKFSGPVDQHAIKMDFIRRANNPRRAFRMKVGVAGGRERVVVPGMVRYHYREPPPLLPSRREHVRCTRALERLKASGAYDESDDDDNKKPKTKICMNMECPKYTGEGDGQCPHDAADLLPASEVDAADDLRAIQTKIENPSESSDLSDSDLEYLTASVKRRKTSQCEDKVKVKRGRDRGDLDDDEAEELLGIVEQQLNKLDEKLVKLLAWQRLQQVLVGEAVGGWWRRAALSPRLQARVVRSVERARLARAGVRHAPHLPLPSELLSAAERRRIATAVWGPHRPRPRPHPRTHQHRPHHALTDRVLRAALSPLNTNNRNGVGETAGRPVGMRLSRLTIGSDSSCDVILDSTQCDRLSSLHATIFFDEVTRQFELINYSEWGSRVDGVLYACDAARDPGDVPSGEGQGDAALPPSGLHHVLRRAHRVNGSMVSTGPLTAECRCPPAAPPSAAWEGSALVGHGALLQFGCLSYVFSVADATAFPYETSIEDPAL